MTEFSTQSKVSELRSTGSYQHITGLDITMHISIRMQISKSLNYIKHDINNLLLPKNLFLHQHSFQVALSSFHYYVLVVGRVEYFLNLDEILVLSKMFAKVDLIVKFKTLFWGGVFEDGDDFDGDGLLCVGIDAVVYL
jgi:hypothetical protein